MDERKEETAWSCFAHTGRVQDYLIYTQCRQQGAARQEVSHADQYGRTGDTGKEYR